MAFLGSTIGNFNEEELDCFLEVISANLQPGDFFLLGVDLVKDPSVVEAAYNDKAGVTARFTQNLFARMNRELGTKLDPSSVRHIAFYNDALERMEIYAEFQEEVHIELGELGRSFRIAPGERILTEVSRKFRVDEMAATFARFGWALRELYQDENKYMAVMLLERKAHPVKKTWKISPRAQLRVWKGGLRNAALANMTRLQMRSLCLRAATAQLLPGSKGFAFWPHGKNDACRKSVRLQPPNRLQPTRVASAFTQPLRCQQATMRKLDRDGAMAVHSCPRTVMPLRIATFNIENLDTTESGKRPSLEERIAVLRPQLARLHADILCLQEVHAQGENNKRTLVALKKLLDGTLYAEFKISHTTTQDEIPFSKRNLVTLSRFPITETKQVKHDLISPPQYRSVTTEPNEEAAKNLNWERPILHTRHDIDDGAIHVLNIHLKSKCPTEITGQKESPYAWKSASGWAEGFFISSMKRVGQAIEVRRAIDAVFDEDPEAKIAVVGAISSMNTAMLTMMKFRFKPSAVGSEDTRQPKPQLTCHGSLRVHGSRNLTVLVHPPREPQYARSRPGITLHVGYVSRHRDSQ